MFGVRVLGSGAGAKRTLDDRADGGGDELLHLLVKRPSPTDRKFDASARDLSQNGPRSRAAGSQGHDPGHVLDRAGHVLYRVGHVSRRGYLGDLGEDEGVEERRVEAALLDANAQIG